MRLFLAGIMLCGLLAAADSRTFQRTVPLPTSGAVFLETHKGTTRISAWDRSEVAIEARIELTGSSANDRRRYELTEIEVDAASDSVHIRARYPNERLFRDHTEIVSPEIHYTIRMPRTARLSLRDSRNDIEIGGLAGALNIDTHRGRVRVHEFSGALEARTHRGNLEVEFASFTGASSVETYRGTAELILPRDSRFDLSTSLDRRAILDSDFTVLARMAHRRGQLLEGTVNGGGPALRLETTRGHILLRAK